MKLLAVNIPSTYFNRHPGAGRLGQNPGTLISGLLPNILIIAGVILLFIIVIGGFTLLVGAGENTSPQDLARSRAITSSALIGFLLVVSAYFILQIIGVAIGVPFTNNLALP